MACGIFPDQGSNPWPLHWQAILNHCATREVPKHLLISPPKLLWVHMRRLPYWENSGGGTSPTMVTLSRGGGLTPWNPCSHLKMGWAISSLIDLISPTWRNEKRNWMVFSNLNEKQRGHEAGIYLHWWNIWNYIGQHGKSFLVNHDFLARSKHMTTRGTYQTSLIPGNSLF